MLAFPDRMSINGGPLCARNHTPCGSKQSRPCCAAEAIQPARQGHLSALSAWEVMRTPAPEYFINREEATKEFIEASEADVKQMTKPEGKEDLTKKPATKAITDMMQSQQTLAPQPEEMQKMMDAQSPTMSVKKFQTQAALPSDKNAA